GAPAQARRRRAPHRAQPGARIRSDAPRPRRALGHAHAHRHARRRRPRPAPVVRAGAVGRLARHGPLGATVGVAADHLPALAPAAGLGRRVAPRRAAGRRRRRRPRLALVATKFVATPASVFLCPTSTASRAPSRRGRACDRTRADAPAATPTGRAAPRRAAATAPSASRSRAAAAPRARPGARPTASSRADDRAPPPAPRARPTPPPAPPPPPTATTP